MNSWSLKFVTKKQKDERDKGLRGWEEGTTKILFIREKKKEKKWPKWSRSKETARKTKTALI